MERNVCYNNKNSTAKWWRHMRETPVPNHIKLDAIEFTKRSIIIAAAIDTLLLLI